MGLPAILPRGEQLQDVPRDVGGQREEDRRQGLQGGQGEGPLQAGRHAGLRRLRQPRHQQGQGVCEAQVHRREARGGARARGGHGAHDIQARLKTLLLDGNELHYKLLCPKSNELHYKLLFLESNVITLQITIFNE